MLALKQLCLMNPADRRSAQTGSLGLKVGKQKFNLQVQSQGVQTGERVLAKIESEKIPFERMADLGMRDKMYAVVKEALDASGNIVLITAPKGDGLTTTWITALNAAVISAPMGPRVTHTVPISKASPGVRSSGSGRCPTIWSTPSVGAA